MTDKVLLTLIAVLFLIDTYATAAVYKLVPWFPLSTMIHLLLQVVEIVGLIIVLGLFVGLGVCCVAVGLYGADHVD